MSCIALDGGELYHVLSRLSGRVRVTTDPFQGIPQVWSHSRMGFVGERTGYYTHLSNLIHAGSSLCDDSSKAPCANTFQRQKGHGE